VNNRANEQHPSFADEPTQALAGDADMSHTKQSGDRPNPAPPPNNTSPRRSRLASGVLSSLTSTSLSALRLTNLTQLFLEDGKNDVLRYVGYGAVALGAAVAATATAFEQGWVQAVEWETQTLFLRHRGARPPQSDVVIFGNGRVLPRGI